MYPGCIYGGIASLCTLSVYGGIASLCTLVYIPGLYLSVYLGVHTRVIPPCVCTVVYTRVYAVLCVPGVYTRVYASPTIPVSLLVDVPFLVQRCFL